MKRLRVPTHTGYDLMLLSVILALLGIGLAMVYSASGIKALDAQDDPRYFLVQQSEWVAIGLAAMLVVARIDYHRYRRLALPGLAIAIALLAVVLVPGIGTRVGGASRWLRVSSFAGLQPAELAKLALVLYLAFWLAAKHELVGRWSVDGAVRRGAHHRGGARDRGARSRHRDRHGRHRPRHVLRRRRPAHRVRRTGRACDDLRGRGRGRAAVPGCCDS